MSVVPELIMLSVMGKLLLCLGATSVKIEEEANVLVSLLSTVQSRLMKKKAC